MIHPDTNIYLYLIRHAQSTENENPKLGQPPDTPLSKLGIEQAKALGQWLKKESIFFDHVYYSPYLRAASTCEISTAYLPLVTTVRSDDRLVELSQGMWEGDNHEVRYTPEIYRQMAEMRMDFQPPGGESQNEVKFRAVGWLQDAVHNPTHLESGQIIRIAAYSHCITINTILQHILGSDSALTWRFHTNNASVTKFVFNIRGWWPKYWNRVP